MSSVTNRIILSAHSTETDCFLPECASSSKEKVMQLKTHSSRATLKNVLVVCVNLSIFGFLIYWLKSSFNIEYFVSHLSGIPLSALILPAALNLLAIFFHAVRLCQLGPWSFSTAFQIVNLGAGLNIVLPFRLGDVARIYYARRGFSISATKLIAISLIEKLLDLTAISLLALLAILVGTSWFAGIDFALYTIPPLVVACLAMVISKKFLLFTEIRISWVHTLNRWAFQFRRELKIENLVNVIGLTGAIWLTNVFMVLSWFMVILPSFGLWDAVCILIITALVIALPGAPAGVGIFEAGIVAYLSGVLGTGGEHALASAVVFHATMAIPQLIITLLCVVRIMIGRAYPSADQTI